MKTPSIHLIPCVGLLLFSLGHVEARTYYYDEAGRLTQVAYPGGQGIRYAYDEADNLTLEESIAVPKAPANLIVVRASLTTAQLRWQDEDASETGFVVQRRLATNYEWQTVAMLPAGTTTHDDEALSADQNYVYRVYATGARGNSAYSNAGTAAGMDSEPFEIALFQKATESTANRVKLSFTGAGGTSYALESSPDLSPGSWEASAFSDTPNGATTKTSIEGNGSNVTLYFDIFSATEPVFYRIIKSD